MDLLFLDLGNVLKTKREEKRDCRSKSDSGEVTERVVFCVRPSHLPPRTSKWIKS